MKKVSIEIAESELSTVLTLLSGFESKQIIVEDINDLQSAELIAVRNALKDSETASKERWISLEEAKKRFKIGG